MGVTRYARQSAMGDRTRRGSEAMFTSTVPTFPTGESSYKESLQHVIRLYVQTLRYINHDIIGSS